ncbi:MAG: PQQ-binding-like beta-propeller repeat protein, partial [Psychromonas sp.]|nr:PQQ-binding-like beta-propeller repeat protein [Psychromonas sp.]
ENGKVYQLDKFTGKKRWKVSLDTDLSTGVAIDADNVYIGSIDGSIIALNKQTGDQVWSAKLSSEPVSPPAVYSGHVVIHANNGDIFNLQADTGELRWRYSTNQPALTIRGTGRPQFFGEYTVIGLANGKLILLDLASGELRWEDRVTTPKGETEIERIVDVDGAPAVTKNKLFAVSYQGRVVAYDLQSGKPMWA